MCHFAVFGCLEWQKVLFRSIDHCGLCWLCCWARCWMLQDMDSMKASGVCYIKVGKLNHLERSQIWLVTVNKTGIVRLTVQYNMIVSVCFMYYPGGFLRQTSADILFLKECPIYIQQLCDFGGRTPQHIPGTQTNTIGPTYCKLRDGGKPLQLAAIRSSNQLEYKVWLGCYICHSDM